MTKWQAFEALSQISRYVIPSVITTLHDVSHYSLSITRALVSVRREYAPQYACARTFPVRQGPTSAHIDPIGGWDCPTGGGLGPLIRTFTHLVEHGRPRPRPK